MENSTGSVPVFPNVPGMRVRDRITISSAGISGLGDRLGEIADYLEERAQHGRTSMVGTYGFITQEGSMAYDGVLGDYELARIALCTQLRRLRDLARAAGDCYVSTESLLDERHRGIG